MVAFSWHEQVPDRCVAQRALTGAITGRWSLEEARQKIGPWADDIENANLGLGRLSSVFKEL